ncbi:phage/plasmid replication protein, II/X family [Paraburkholderia fungorum]|uniref:phage/plasmid replication protein, II/X family n=1 Tax=Paraburkholderia fungorum TaxID=134537 RepID=UPI0038B71BDA
MIDLLDLLVYIKHKPFGNTRVKEFENGSDDKKNQYSKTVILNSCGSPVHVISLNDRDAVSIRCSPLKVLQGHNMFGSNNVCAIASSIICGTLDCLNIPYAQEQREAWSAGEFTIRAIDITHRFKLSDGLTSFDICSHLLRTSPMKLCKPQWLDQGIGVRLCTENSGLKWLLYDKEQELLDKRTKAFPYLKAVVGSDARNIWRSLVEIAASTIRAELKLSKTYLKRHHLTNGRMWTAKRAQEIYLSELNALSMDAPISINRAVARVRSRPLLTTLLLWSNGHDLHAILPKSTFNSHRQAIVKQASIDIEKHIPAARSLKLSQIFCRENAHILPDKRVFGKAAFLPIG